MKIAIDTGPLKSGDVIRGVGVYVRELLAFTKIQGINAFSSDLGRYNVVHFTRFNPFSISIPFKKPPKTKFVLTIYDLIPLIYPNHYPPGIRGKINWLINKYLIKKNIDAIITISETSKKDICRFIGIKPEKVFVTYLAARSVFKKLEIGNFKSEIAKRYNLPERFALYIGDVNYNKNIPNLIKACRIAKVPLVIAGKQATQIEEMNLNHSELLHLKNIDWSDVIRIGFVPDEILAELCNIASVYIQPSIYEGFGLPILEAVACGTPLVVSKTQVFMELLGDKITYVDPNNPKEMAASILNPNRNIKIPNIYNWKKTAKETFMVYEYVHEL